VGGDAAAPMQPLEWPSDNWGRFIAFATNFCAEFRLLCGVDRIEAMAYIRPPFASREGT
jgi:hypothetical protein